MSRPERRRLDYPGLDAEARRDVGSWVARLTGDTARIYTRDQDEYDGAITCTCGPSAEFQPRGKDDGWLEHSVLSEVPFDAWPVAVLHVTTDILVRIAETSVC